MNSTKPRKKKQGSHRRVQQRPQVNAEGIRELKVRLDEPALSGDASALKELVSKELNIPLQELPPVQLLKKSIDARRGNVLFLLLIKVGEVEEYQVRHASLKPKMQTGRVVVVGDGPAGLFCAFRLAQQGIACIVVERGKKVQPRRRDLKLLNARGGVDSNSNYCFGEGGAGTYSDGKLYTRSHKRGSVRDVLEILAQYGAPEQILTDARPHIGSNLLPQIISAMREALEAVGVQFCFGEQMVDVLIDGEQSERRVAGIVTEDVETREKREIAAEAVVLATGHSARDIYELCIRRSISVAAKPFALGVRVEHPQALINEIQFGQHAQHPRLGAASYRLVQQVAGRGVFSFCMCPGGWIVPAATDPEHLVVNGMSLSKRDSPYANSGVVVGIELEDLRAAGLEGPLAGMELQARAERAAQVAGGGENRAPAIRVADFLAGKDSSTLPKTSYLPGLSAVSMAEVLDQTGLPLAQKLKEALQAFGKKLKGFDSEEGIIVGVESRTSSPLKMLRSPESLESPSLEGFFPAGEGGGFAGGIISAAVDGMVVAEKVAQRVTGSVGGGIPL